MNDLVSKIERDEREFYEWLGDNEIPVELMFDPFVSHFIREAFLFGYSEGHADGMKLIVSSKKWQRENS